MSSPFAALLILGLAGASRVPPSRLPPAPATFDGCLAPFEMRGAVASGLAAPPAAAVRAARGAVEGEVVSARLCRRGGGFVYVVIMLRRDGRVVSVLVDGDRAWVEGLR